MECITGEVIAKFNMSDDEVNVFKKHSSCKQLESRDDSKISFQDIYRKNVWGEHVRSGIGSTVGYAVSATKVLSSVIAYIKKQLDITRVRILDAPCGDMTWMQHLLKTRNDIDYTGFDIVPELNSGTQNKFQDLVFSRMMLQHIHNDDVSKDIEEVSTSGSKFILMTSFPNNRENRELQKPGERFHLIHFEIPPVSLPPPLCYSRDGSEEDNLHYLHLWRLLLLQVSNCSVTHRIPLRLSTTALQCFSCPNESYVTQVQRYR